MSRSIAALLQQVTPHLPFLEAEILLSYHLNKPRTYLYAWPEFIVDEEITEQFFSSVQKRQTGMPIAYLTGEREFWSLPFKVTTDTLVPRPETELLVEEILAWYPNPSTPISVADIGTGCGTIALALAHERPLWEIVATDICKKALAVAKENAKLLGVSNIVFYGGDGCHALPPLKKYDVIVSNPPYIGLSEREMLSRELSFEPDFALYAGKDGLDVIRMLITTASAYLKHKGWLVVEHGCHQGDLVKELFVNNGYQHCRIVYDLAGKKRITLGQFHNCQIWTKINLRVGEKI